MLKSINLLGSSDHVILRRALMVTLLCFAFMKPFPLALAQERVNPAVETAVKGAVETWLKGRFKVDSVGRTAMPGMIEVRIGTDLIYVDEKGQFAIVEGQMINLKTGENLTAARLEEINRVDFAKLPKELAIKTVRGSGKRTLAVFEDPYCSFCRTYRKTLTELNNVTIYTYFYPTLASGLVFTPLE